MPIAGRTTLPKPFSPPVKLVQRNAIAYVSAEKASVSKEKYTPLRRKIKAPMMVAKTAENATANSNGNTSWPSNQCFWESAAA